MKNKEITFADSLYRGFYDLVRKTPALNYLAHKVMQSEAVHHFALYRKIYRSVIARKAQKYLQAPPFLEITVTDMCNSRCIMCPPQVHLGKTILNQELFKRICLQARELGIEKMIITGGEPLLDKYIFDKIRFAKSAGFSYVHMFTNGSLMTEEKARELIGTGLDSLAWSIDSADKKEYERIRLGLNFDKVVGNIRRFMEIRMEMDVDIPLTRVNMVCLPQNKERRQEFRRFFGKFVDIVEIIDSHNFGGSLSAHDIVTGESDEYSQKTHYPCHLLFTKAVVYPDGALKKCSIDQASHAVMGNLTKQSLKDILFSQRFLSLKKDHLKDIFNEPGCDVCTHKESWWVDY